MAIARKDVRAIVEDESIDSDVRTKKLLDLLHGEIDAIRDEKDSLQAELDQAKKDLDGANKAKEKAEKDLDDLKNAEAAKTARQGKVDAYKAQLKELGITDKRIATIVKASGEAIDALELNKDGTIKGADKLLESIKTEWEEFIPETVVKGAKTPTPPAGGKTGMSRSKVMAIKDRTERRKAMSDPNNWPNADIPDTPNDTKE